MSKGPAEDALMTVVVHRTVGVDGADAACGFQSTRSRRGRDGNIGDEVDEARMLWWKCSK